MKIVSVQPLETRAFIIENKRAPTLLFGN